MTGRTTESVLELKSLGVCEEERSLYDEFSRTMTFQDECYKVSLPSKEYHESLEDNYLLSVKRIRGLLRCLRNDPEILELYDRTIQDQLAKGIIEPVLLDEGTSS